MRLQASHARPYIAKQHAPCTHTSHFQRSPFKASSPQEGHKRIAPLLATCCEVTNSLYVSSYMSAAICQQLYVSSYVSAAICQQLYVSSYVSAAICQHLCVSTLSVSSYMSAAWGTAGRSAGMPEYGLFCVTKSLGQRTGRAHNVPSAFSRSS